MSAHGTVLRQPGTVVVIGESGETIGFNPVGPFDGAGPHVHATRVRAGDPVFDSALRYLDSGTATVLVIGTRGMSGHAVIGADRVAGRLSWPELPAQVIDDARSMLGSRRTVHRTYCLGRDGSSAGFQVWMQSN